MSKTVIVVGGSLAGLMHGLLLKRQGVNVTIIEQDPSSARVGNEAGVGFSENVIELLRRVDVTGVPLAIDCQASKFAWKKNPNLWVAKGMRSLSSWSLFYQVLRANFDGLPSNACPNPPGPLSGDGRAEYRAGCKVTDLALTEDGARVSFVDVANAKEDLIEANMVLGADGRHSTIRRLMGVPAQAQYSGYITWRGTVPDSQVSHATATYFKDTTALNFTGDSYTIVYPIPTDDGKIDYGERLFNVVIYYNVEDGSPEMTDIFTDINGQHHRNTVPKGLVQPDIWKPIFKDMSEKLAPPFAELVDKVQTPFVTKIIDTSWCPTPSFSEGRVILVGDALCGARPHIAKSTEQAAFHCLSLSKVWSGTMTQKQWDNMVLTYAERTWTVSNILGVFGQGKIIQLLKYFLAYIFFLVRIQVLRKYIL